MFNLIEKFYFELLPRENGLVIAEKRGLKLDRKLDTAWTNLRIQDSEYFKSKKILQRVLAMELRDKMENNPGLQLADLVVSPIGRHILDKKVILRWQIVRQKLLRNQNGTEDGLVVLPNK